MYFYYFVFIIIGSLFATMSFVNGQINLGNLVNQSKIVNNGSLSLSNLVNQSKIVNNGPLSLSNLIKESR